ncbi:collagen-like protein [Fodinibius saliphilus]|uniref:collagen-like protein n=1 Tax=Fodinibius saliphilus TaxID=1920650 RepID=UPI001108400A|nr:collagen-like protein [Fodinibius saliphilus]
MRRFSRVVILFLIAVFPLFMGCEGPAGEQGTQGPEGPQGPVGPAGDDGSMMYSGKGAPASSTGSNGDYYLNTNTGEMYGPKKDSGWGNPIMVLMGQDGEDGSKFHAGSGAPASSLGENGDFYLDKSNYNMYGPKTSQGWGTAVNLKGADGNANVTRYIYPQHDFSSSPQFVAVFSNLTETEMKQSSWSVYLMYDTGSNQIYYSVPGRARNIQYSVEHNFVNGNVYFRINTEPNKTGIPYDQIEIIRTEANNTQDNTEVDDTGIVTLKKMEVVDQQSFKEFYNFE